MDFCQNGKNDDNIKKMHNPFTDRKMGSTHMYQLKASYV